MIPSASRSGIPIALNAGWGRSATIGSVRYPVASVVVEMPN